MEFRYSYKAERQLMALPRQTLQRIKEKMEFFAMQENPLTFAKYILIKKEYRFRVGDYRLLCEVKNEVIWIVKIERRDKAYD